MGFLKFIFYFIYFCLHRVFVAACGLSLVAVSGVGGAGAGGATLSCHARASH